MAKKNLHIERVEWRIRLSDGETYGNLVEITPREIKNRKDTSMQINEIYEILLPNAIETINEIIFGKLTPQEIIKDMNKQFALIGDKIGKKFKK